MGAASKDEKEYSDREDEEEEEETADEPWSREGNAVNKKCGPLVYLP
jgi:hypothetical protein